MFSILNCSIESSYIYPNIQTDKRPKSFSSLINHVPPDTIEFTPLRQVPL
jgi:hypothetical protein